MHPTLTQLMAALSTGAIRIVDLAHTLTESFPSLVLPPEFAQASGFRRDTISRYDDAGPAWYWNTISMSEHTGTHFDAPAHWITGKDHADGTVDTLDCRGFIAPAAVVDASAEVALCDDWILDVAFLTRWEAIHGRIPARGWLAFRTDWAHRIDDPARFLNLRDDGAHTPGPSREAVEWLIHERDVLGFAVETINTDAGQSHTWPLPLPCHTLMHGANRYGLQCLRNLDQLPPQGALIVAAPLKIEAGSGSPLRPFALVPA